MATTNNGLVSGKMLQKTRETHAQSLQAWKERGNGTTVWRCVSCEETNEARKPEAKDIASGRTCWDSATVCLKCGSTNFVQVYPSGSTVAHSLSGKKKNRITVRKTRK